jgi:hypothetical protein
MIGVPRLLDLKAPPEVGKTYLVPVTDVNGSNARPMPVIGHEHNDSDIGQPNMDHIHLDVRFATDAELAEANFDPHQLRCMYSQFDGPAGVCTLAYRTDRRRDKEPLRVWEEPRVCVRDEFPQGLHYKAGNSLHVLASKLKADGFRLKPDCKTCPHKGTRLDNVKAKNGVLMCPTHGLEFAPDTGEVIC